MPRPARTACRRSAAPCGRARSGRRSRIRADLSAVSADVRLPAGDAGRAAVPVRRPGGGWSAASCGRRRWARGRTRDPAGHAGLRAAIARHVGVARAVRAGAGRRARHQRRAAGARPGRPGAARAGRPGGGRGARLPAGAAAVPVARRPGGRRAGRRRGPGRRRPAGRRPAGLRHARRTSSRSACRCRWPAGCALLAWAERRGRGGRRGRLRQRVPVRRPPARAAAEPRPGRPGGLRRLVLQGACCRRCGSASCVAPPSLRGALRAAK